LALNLALGILVARLNMKPLGNGVSSDPDLIPNQSRTFCKYFVDARRSFGKISLSRFASQGTRSLYLDHGIPIFERILASTV
jgi:hypothetical protein